MVSGWGIASLSHVLLIVVTAIACFIAVARVRTAIDDRDTRWGLITLLSLCGFWSAFTAGRLVVSSRELTLAFYMLGLIVGLATVGAWLYFCSAYTGRTYHRESTYRWFALFVYLVIIAVKVTSPIHGLYFSMDASTPTDVVIELGVLHWIVSGLAYSLSAIGFYMLFDAFRESNYVTTRLGLLVGLAGISGAFTVYSYLNPDLSTVSYEPVGVALFALGVLNVADGTFLAVRRFGREQLIDELDESIVILDADGVVRDANEAAQGLFPELPDAIGEPVADAVPDLSEYLTAKSPRVISMNRSDSQRHFLLSSQTLTAGETTIGRTIVFTDITAIERQRREIERHRTQRIEFAEAITHELRNAINVTQGHLELVQSRLNPDDDVEIRDSLETITSITDRMEGIVSDLAMIAKYGQPVEETMAVELSAIAREGWELVPTTDERLRISTDATIEADPTRLRKLFETLFSFSLSNGATEVEVEFVDGAILVTDDGNPLTEADAERALAYGDAVPDAESGMLLPVVRTLADAHGWDLTIETEYHEGVRIRLTT